MDALLVITILCSSCGLISPSALPDLDELCPYVRSCDQKVDQLNDDIAQSCCAPCSCSDACTITDTCCPDIVTTPQPSKQFPCRTQAEIYGKYLKIDAMIDTLRDFRVIDECPTGYQVERFGNESITKCKEASDLVDVIFVTSLHSGQTYLNEHCARCNGEDDLVKWDLYLTSFANGLLFSSFEERDEYLLKTAHFEIVPPPSYAASTAFCSTTSITKCNVTGLWNYHDQELEKKCESVNSFFFPDYSRLPFLNVYCFMCNNPKETIVPKRCRRASNTFKPGLKSNIFSVFHALIIPEDIKDKVVARDQSQCSTGQILDPVSKRCTDLHCPPGTIPQYIGMCKPILDKVIGYTVRTQFKLTTVSDAGTQSANYNMLLDDMAIITKRLTRNKFLKCDVCSLLILRTDNIINFQLDMQSGDKCNYIALLENVFITYKTLPLIMYSKGMQANLTLAYANAEFDPMSSILASRYRKRCRLNVAYSPSIIHHCPRITFNIADISDKCNGSCFQSKLDPFSFYLGNGTYIICLNHYKQVFDSLNHAHANRSDRYILYALLITYLRILKSFGV